MTGQGAPRIALLGESDWSVLLAEGLARYTDLRATPVVLNRANDALRPGWWRDLLSADVVVRIGLRPGARTWRGRALDRVLRAIHILHRGQRTVYYWMGTDVLNTLDDASAGVTPAWTSRELAHATHFTGTPSLSEELAELGIDSEFMPFPFDWMWTGDDLPPMPAEFSVLSYVPFRRPDYYGRSMLLEAATRLPPVRFRIMGSDSSGLNVPDNLEFLGWQTDPTPWYRGTSCVVRLVEHDGAGGTVVEALSFGRPVVYTRKQPHTIHVPYGDTDALVEAIRALYDRHEAGELTPDADAAAFIRETYDPARCYRHLAARLRQVAAG